RDFYVAQTLFPAHFARLVVQDAVGEVVHLGRELIGLGKTHFAFAGGAFQTAIAVGGVEPEPAFLSRRHDAIVAVDQISRATISQYSAGETHRPENRFIHLLEFDFVGLGLDGGDFDRFFAG